MRSLERWVAGAKSWAGLSEWWIMDTDVGVLDISGSYA